MKSRQGFVSNSSSSSFVILGTDLPGQTLVDKFVAGDAHKDMRLLAQDNEDYGVLLEPGNKLEKGNRVLALGLVLLEGEGGDSCNFDLSDATKKFDILRDFGITRVKLIADTVDR
jgi:hypothetical protein